MNALTMLKRLREDVDAVAARKVAEEAAELKASEDALAPCLALIQELHAEGVVLVDDEGRHRPLLDMKNDRLSSGRMYLHAFASRWFWALELTGRSDGTVWAVFTSTGGGRNPEEMPKKGFRSGASAAAWLARVIAERWDRTTDLGSDR